MDSKKTEIAVRFNPLFFLRFFLFVIMLIGIFYILAPYYISFKVWIIRPLVQLFYGSKPAPYIRPIPAYRGISIALVCYIALVCSSLQKKTIRQFLPLKWKLFVASLLGIIAYEIISVVVEIVSQGFIGYYVTAVMLSVGSILLTLLLWFLLFPSLKNYLRITEF